LCEYCPRRIVERDGQHKDTLTNAWENVVPCSASNALTCGITERSDRAMSSVNRNRMFGRAAAADAGAALDVPGTTIPAATAITASTAVNLARTSQPFLL